jgi:hypothetical protein
LLLDIRYTYFKLKKFFKLHLKDSKMKSLSEKRDMIHAWVDTAVEREVDRLLVQIHTNGNNLYDQKLTEELFMRRQRHLDGISESFTKTEVQAKLEAMIKGHAV